MMGSKKINRKKFLSSIAKGAAAVFLISTLSGKFFKSKSITQSKEKLSRIKINIHPDAVMRNEKV